MYGYTFIESTLKHQTANMWNFQLNIAYENSFKHFVLILMLNLEKSTFLKNYELQTKWRISTTIDFKLMIASKFYIKMLMFELPSLHRYLTFNTFEVI